MANRYLLGFDVGSSSVKASLVNADSGKCVATAFYPEKEAPIMAVKAGWAEQDPQMWWDNAKLALKKIMADAGATAEDVKAIGISYQMHGLVCVDKNLKALRPSIIWCDSRAVPYGEKAFKDLGSPRPMRRFIRSCFLATISLCACQVWLTQLSVVFLRVCSGISRTTR